MDTGDRSESGRTTNWMPGSPQQKQATCQSCSRLQEAYDKTTRLCLRHEHYLEVVGLWKGM